VQQEAMTESAYNYWKMVRETTETLGGLFDSTPGAAVGNIRCITNPDEPVIGFFSSGSIEEKRSFISRADLPSAFVKYVAPDCEIDSIGIQDMENSRDINGILAPTYFIGASHAPILNGYIYTTDYCSDCRVYLGGVTKRPDFWE
jgi:hypothetical protein